MSWRRLGVGGFDVVRDGDRARELLSYVPDQPYSYWRKLSGREFLQFIAELYGLSKQAAEQRIGEMIDLFNLHDLPSTI